MKFIAIIQIPVTRVINASNITTAERDAKKLANYLGGKLHTLELETPQEYHKIGEEKEEHD